MKALQALAFITFSFIFVWSLERLGQGPAPTWGEDIYPVANSEDCPSTHYWVSGGSFAPSKEDPNIWVCAGGNWCHGACIPRR